MRARARFVGLVIFISCFLSLLLLLHQPPKPQEVHLHPRNVPLFPPDTTPISESNSQSINKAVVVGALSSENTSWVITDLPSWTPHVYAVDNTSAPLHTPVNKGREALPYLTYILDNYETLPTVTAFLHSHRHGWPRAWHTDAYGYSNVVSLDTLNIAHVLRRGYVNLRCDPEPGCWPDAEIRFDRDDDAETVSGATELAMPRAWAELFPDTGLPPVIAAPCCAQFAVSRDAVLARPRADYARMRDWLLRTSLDDNVSGRVFEYLWHFIFGMPAVDCPKVETCYCETYGQCEDWRWAV